MWGRPDTNMFLRRILHTNMSRSGGCTAELRQRWQKQREWKNTFIPDGGLQYSEEVFDQNVSPSHDKFVAQLAVAQLTGYCLLTNCHATSAQMLDETDATRS